MIPASIRRTWAFALLFLACCLTLSACVYFNTFYNAKKFYRQAEKERVKHEEDYAGWEFDGAGPEMQRGRSNKADQLYDKAARKASKVLDKYKESDLVDDAMLLMGKAFYWRGEYLQAMDPFAIWKPISPLVNISTRPDIGARKRSNRSGFTARRNNSIARFLETRKKKSPCRRGCGWERWHSSARITLLRFRSSARR